MHGEDETLWLVVGGNYAGQTRKLPTAPHKDIMHGHLTAAIIFGKLRNCRSDMWMADEIVAWSWSEGEQGKRREYHVGSSTQGAKTKALPGPRRIVSSSSPYVLSEPDVQPPAEMTPNRRSGGTSRNIANVRCFRCKELGHYKADCPQKDADRKH
eukprot:3935124-Amphidinium_carterae.2